MTKTLDEEVHGKPVFWISVYLDTETLIPHHLCLSDHKVVEL